MCHSYQGQVNAARTLCRRAVMQGCLTTTTGKGCQGRTLAPGPLQPWYKRASAQMLWSNLRLGAHLLLITVAKEHVSNVWRDPPPVCPCKHPRASTSTSLNSSMAKMAGVSPWEHSPVLQGHSQGNAFLLRESLSGLFKCRLTNPLCY